MRYLTLLFLTLLLPCLACNAKGTDKDFILQHLNTNVYTLDSEASVVVLFERRTEEITEEHFIYSKKEAVHRIIKVLKADALGADNNVADVHVYFPNDDYQNYVYNVKGTTYNLGVAGITETSLVHEDVYKKELINNQYAASFSLPAVKEGSVFEYSYERVTKFNSWLITWDIQEDYPKLVSEFRIIYPDKFEFTTIAHVRTKPVEYHNVDDAEKSKDEYCHVGSKLADGTVHYSSFWVRRNIPVIKKEPFVANVNNFKERLELQVTGFMSGSGLTHFGNSWEKMNKELWGKDNIENDVAGKNSYLDEITDSLTKNIAGNPAKTKAIYSYVRSQIRYTHRRAFYSRRSLKDVYERKEGNAVEINLLLTAMLVHAGIDASPVVLSTADNISLSQVFPVRDRFNYVITEVAIDSQRILLDATDKNNHFGQLPAYCYNGFAWVLGDEGHSLDLNPDMITDKIVYAVKYSDFTDTSAKLEITYKAGDISSQSIRKRWAADEHARQAHFDEFERSCLRGTTLRGQEVTGLADPDTNVVIHYKCDIKFDSGAGVYYMNAVLMKLYASNPLKATVRQLPLEFPCKVQYRYYMNAILPKDVEPDSLPKPVRLNYDENKLVFNKTMAFYNNMHTLTVNADYEANATEFDPGEYETISTFFQKMIEECNEVITLKKNARK